MNVQSSFSPTELDRVKQHNVREDLNGKPAEGELTAALVQLKKGKAGRNSQIIPEMVKRSETVLTLLLDI